MNADAIDAAAVCASCVCDWGVGASLAGLFEHWHLGWREQTSDPPLVIVRRCLTHDNAWRRCVNSDRVAPPSLPRDGANSIMDTACRYRCSGYFFSFLDAAFALCSFTRDFTILAISL